MPRTSDLAAAITGTVYELLNLIIRIGFLAILVWAGSILLSKGIEVLERVRT